MTDGKMDRELVKEWVAALRSGKYAQGKHALRTQTNAYCCLGVAYDIATEGKGWVNESGWVTSDGFSTDLSYDLNLRLGLSFSDVRRLMRMNDKLGTSFSGIADWIEANILGGAE